MDEIIDNVIYKSEGDMLEKRQLWMPLQKTQSGDFLGILSDDSLDRDDEIVGEPVHAEIATKKALPALVDHRNAMNSFAGGWTNIEHIKKTGKSAVMAKLTIFKSNPNTSWINELIKEANELGLGVGVSISAIPLEYKWVKINGEKKKMWTKAEILEATLTPLQSNRNSFTFIAKSFDVDNYLEKYNTVSKPKVVEDCVEALMADPDFKPQKGKTKRESAWAVCQAKHGKSCPTSQSSINDTTNQEEINMEEEQFKQLLELGKSTNEGMKKNAEAIQAIRKELDEKPEPAPAKPEPAESEEEEKTEKSVKNRREVLKHVAANVSESESQNGNVEKTIKRGESGFSLHDMLCMSFERNDFLN